MTASELRALRGRIGRPATLRAYRVQSGLYIFQVASGIGATSEALHRAEDGEAGCEETISAAIRWIAANHKTTGAL